MRKDKVNTKISRKQVFKRALMTVLETGHNGSDSYHKHMEIVIDTLDKLSTSEIDSLGYVLANIKKYEYITTEWKEENLYRHYRLLNS